MARQKKRKEKTDDDPIRIAHLHIVPSEQNQTERQQARVLVDPRVAEDCNGNFYSVAIVFPFSFEPMPMNPCGTASLRYVSSCPLQASRSLIFVPSLVCRAEQTKKIPSRRQGWVKMRINNYWLNSLSGLINFREKWSRAFFRCLFF